MINKTIVATLLVLLCCGSAFFARAQSGPIVTISLVQEGGAADANTNEFSRQIRREITALLQYRYTLQFKALNGNFNPETIAGHFDQLFADSETDIVIGVGPLTCGILAARERFPKPALAAIIIDQNLQHIPVTPAGTSGVSNFSYITSPFSIERDLKTLHRISPYKKIGIVGGNNLITRLPFLDKLVDGVLTTFQAEHVLLPFKTDAATTINSFPPDLDAVYLFPLFNEVDESGLTDFFDEINRRKLPSAAILGEEYLMKGALMAYSATGNLQRMPRRIALSVMKILEGTNAADLPVDMKTYSEHLLLNMETARATGIFPNWDVMAGATLFNMNKMPNSRKLTMKGVIAEAMQNNLALKVAQFDPLIAQKDIALSVSDLLPQVDVSTSLSWSDELSILSSQGAQGRINWLASGSLSQVVFAEPALANIAIQKLLKKSAEYGLLETELNLVIDAVSAYLNVLQAESNLRIQQQNLKVTRENYDIAKAKEAVGYSGASDINRWESELAQANINFNVANATLRQTKYVVNQLLNRPIDEAFQLDDVTLADEMLLIADNRLQFIDNYGDLKKFADFIVADAMMRLPELKQFDAGISIQERLELSQQRAFYLPTAAVSGSANRILQKYQVPENFPDVDNQTTWNLGVGVQYPVFQGGYRKHVVEQTRLNILQLNDQRADVRNQLELRIRSNIETVGASFSRVELSEVAASAALKNFEIVQNAYSEGQVNITTLIDAQNSALQTNLSALNAVYTFTLDFLNLERSMGFFSFMATQAERDAFFTRLSDYLLKKN